MNIILSFNLNKSVIKLLLNYLLIKVVVADSQSLLAYSKL